MPGFSSDQWDQLLITGGGLIEDREEVSDSAESMIGQSIGPFRLEAVIGDGGMATVYRGVREDPGFRQQVAIKRLKPGLTRIAMESRFFQERQILANLSHPNIATVIDAGLDATQRPYLAMELVSGNPIDLHCTRQSLDFHDRLTLLIRIAAAVQYAHEQSVIHCDLKPGNVLVDQHGEPKLLDFGIAQLISNAESSEEDHQLFTPLYAAPEQLAKKPLSPATDIYQFSVMACKIMTGELPYGKEATSDPQSVIAENRIRKASAGIEDRHIVRPQQVKGDFDRIIQHCLALDPADRYQDMATVTRDLIALSRRQAISLRASNKIYQLSRYLSRHQSAAIIAILGIALFFGAGGYYLSSLKQQQQRNQEIASSLKQQEQRTQEIAVLMEDVLKAIDPMNQNSGESLQDMINAGGFEATQTNPTLLAATLVTAANIDFNQGKYQHAARQYEQAMRLYAQHFGPNHPGLINIGHNYVLSLQQAGNCELAGQKLQDVIAVAEYVQSEELERLGRLQQLVNQCS